VQQARAELVADLRRVDVLLRETKKKLAVAVRVSGTSLTELSGVGPVIAATVIGDVRDVSRFGSRDRFAAYDGTAPIEVSSGNPVIHRLSMRGNRRLNHAIHMAAITQIRYKHSEGRAYYHGQYLQIRSLVSDPDDPDAGLPGPDAALRVVEPLGDDRPRSSCLYRLPGTAPGLPGE
jgi:transposase